MKRLVVVVVLLLMLFLLASCAVASEYRVRELPVLPGYSRSVGIAISDAGVIVGYVTDELGYTHSARWNHDGTLSVDLLSGASYDKQCATGINNKGQIIISVFDDASTQRAYLLNPDGTSKELGSLGGNWTQVNQINDQGQVVGSSLKATGGMDYAFVWDGANGMRELAYGAFAGAINNSGVIVGSITEEPGQLGHAYRWAGTDTTDLGSAFYSGSRANDVNDSGDAAGYVAGPTHDYAVHWMTDGRAIILGDGIANAINDQEQIAGIVNYGYNSFGQPLCTAALWEPDGQCVQLELLPGYAQSWAFDINDAEQVLGFAFDSAANDTRYVLWEPVPEPSGLISLLCGLIGVGGRMIRRR